MAHESAKLLLQRAETYQQRLEAVEAALALGMPLHETRDYLDWLDSLRKSPLADLPVDDRPPPDDR